MTLNNGQFHVVQSELYEHDCKIQLSLIFEKTDEERKLGLEPSFTLDKDGNNKYIKVPTYECHLTGVAKT